MFTKNADGILASNAYNIYDIRPELVDLKTVRGISVNDVLIPMYPGYSTVKNSMGKFDFALYLNRKLSKSEWDYMEHMRSNGIDTTEAVQGVVGFVFGDGNTPPTVDDYMLSGNAVFDYNYTRTVENIISDEYIDYQVMYTITNISDKPITIGEIGLFAYINLYSQYNSSAHTYHHMFERTAFDNPITIEPDGVGQVTYTLRLAKRIK